MSPMRRGLIAVSLTLAVLSIANTQRAFVPVNDQVLRAPNANDWVQWRRDRGATGYSPLDRINRANVGHLRIAWTTPMEAGSLEPEPLVYNGVMYVPQPG